MKRKRCKIPIVKAEQVAESDEKGSDDVEIAVLEKERKPVGFFPFQRKFGEGLPLSSILSDFHGAIVSPGVDWNLPNITRACGLRSYTFDHLLPACAGLDRSDDVLSDRC